MNLGDMFKRLSYGPLSNLSIANNGDGTIAVAKQPAIAQHINDGMIQLYSRFNLNEKELTVNMVDNQTIYNLAAAPYSVTDLLKINSVWDVNGNKVPLNEENDPRSVFTPTLLTLQVPDPEDQQPLFILYRAKATPLVLDPVSLVANIDVPDVLIPALTHYIAYLVFFGMNGQEHQATAQAHLTQFDNQCLQVIDQDLVNSSVVINDSNLFHERGFV